MKKSLLWVVSMLCGLQLTAQTEREVITGASYANEVYYKLGDGNAASSERTAWDIAFSSKMMEINILANNGTDVMVYTYPNGTAADWENVDITGLEMTPMYNSIETWLEGAFVQNQVEGDELDYGWGRYNTSTHFISGDSIFIVETAGGATKKLVIVEKDAPNNTWTFKYANVDGTEEVEETIAANDYADLEYIPYSMDAGQVADVAPASADWDLLFTRYYDYTIPYYVTGVLINDAHVQVQEVSETDLDPAGFSTFQQENFGTLISEIGSDWKSFNMGTMSYEVADTTVYFLKVEKGDDVYSYYEYYKIYFTAFESGSMGGQGVYTFQEEQLSATSAGNPDMIRLLELYPNPSHETLQVVYDFNGEVQLDVLDLNGRVLRSETAVSNGFETQRIDVRSLEPGIYLLRARMGQMSEVRRFVVE
ncbi:MAG: T9SS type A sorting domain-containing protein [Bacteroidales bacterium]